MDDFPTYIIVQRSGQVPKRKGGFRNPKHVEAMLRELYAQDPAPICIVVKMPETCYPQHGKEWLDMFGDDMAATFKRACDGPRPQPDPSASLWNECAEAAAQVHHNIAADGVRGTCESESKGQP